MVEWLNEERNEGSAMGMTHAKRRVWMVSLVDPGGDDGDDDDGDDDDRHGRTVGESGLGGTSSTSSVSAAAAFARSHSSIQSQ